MAREPRSSGFIAAEPIPIVAEQSADPVLERLPGDNSALTDLSVERRQANNRRSGILRAFLYGNFHPRRRESRRFVDQHHFWFDWHEPRVLYLALGVMLLSCTDALFTLNLLKIGASEANAVMAMMLAQGTDSFLASKLGFTSLSLVILVATARRKFFRSLNVEHLLQFFFVGYVLVIVYEIYLFIYVFELNLF